MMDLRNYLEELLHLDPAEEVWPFHLQAMASYGFDRALYGFSRHARSGNDYDRDGYLVLSNHGPEFLDQFFERGMYFHAPMVRWSVENTGACSWRWMSENFDSLTDDERKVLEFNRSHGVTAGYSISFKNVSYRSKGAIGLVAKAGMTQDAVDEMWAEHGRDILVMNQVAHLRISTLPFIGPKTLTARQREVLEWVGEGKTTQDIATILGVSLATVEKHLRLARDLLQAETTAQAVLKASFQNQIFVLES